MSGVYLSGPLDGLEYDGREWYGEIARRLHDHPAVCFCPGNAYLNASYAQARYVEEYNRAAIEASRVVLVNLAGPGRALGTIREIEFAASRRKPVIVIGDLQSSLAAHDLIVVADFEEATQQVLRWMH